MSCEAVKMANGIAKSIQKHPKDYKAYEDMLSVARLIKTDDVKLGYKTSGVLKRLISDGIKHGCEMQMLMPVYKEALRFEAIDIFDSYMLYLEMDREPSERFYQPRRRTLYPVTNALQMIVNDELDELFMSMPPRVGKTTMATMFMTWILGKYPERSNLYSAYSDTITSAFYHGLIEIMEDSYTYNWGRVFPASKIVYKNSKEETLDVDRAKKYHSFTARSLYGTLNGATDCNCIMLADDLIGGIEEALNPERLISAWGKVDNNLITRAKEQAKKIWIGTRWSMADPIGLRLELLYSDSRFSNYRFKVLNLPAMNGNDESNFYYDYGVGFSTEYFRQRRASFEKNNDLASWNAQYMQQPIEREGTLFMPDDFRFFNGVMPDNEPDNVFMAVDPSFGGGDFVAAPVCVQYGDVVYMPDCVYNNGDKRMTVPLIISCIEKYGVKNVQVEASKATEGYKTEIEKQLIDKGIHIALTSKPASTHDSKLNRIYNRAVDIREHMIFLEPDKRPRHYEQFMQNVYSFKYYAKKQHDDAPDSLAQAMDMMFLPSRKPQIFKRIF